MSLIPAPDCLSVYLPLLTAWLAFPVLCVVSFSLLSLVLVRLYIKIRRRRLPSTTSRPDSDSWRYSSNMEKSDGFFSAALPASACDILRPLSQSGPFLSSGALAAQAREQKSVSSNFGMDDIASSGPASPETMGMARKCNESVQQMREEDSEGVRTWKRVVVEYN
jgi:hypothetical protein